jgi:5-methylthioadenosine/S-adenosylhomocysteine deaminase
MRILFQNIDTLVPAGDSVTVKCVDVGIEGETIAFVGKAPDDFAPEKTISGENRFLIPGFINAHTHAYMTIFRNCADDLPFQTWLFGKVMPMEDKLEQGDSYWGTALAACEMIRSGTTCFNDMYIYSMENARAAKESGLRAVLSRGLSGDSRTDPKVLQRFEWAREEMEAYKSEKKLTFRLGPHAPYTCSLEFSRFVAEKAAEWGLGIHTHLGESRTEIQTIREQYDCTPFEYAEKAGFLDLPTVAAHCIYMTESDMRLAAAHNMSVATNPVSNLKLANGIAPVSEMLAAGVNVALGTDGTASNNTLNMVRELSFLCLLHKGKNENAEAVTAKEGLYIATAGGAKALGLDSVTGSIEPGKQADLSVLRTDAVHWTPKADLIAALAYCAQGSDVETVLVGGEVLMENRELRTLDEERIRFETQRIQNRICG